MIMVAMQTTTIARFVLTVRPLTMPCAHNNAYAKHLDKLDEPYQQLDAQAMMEVTGSRCYRHGLYSPGTVMLQPAMYIRNLADGIESNRVRIHETSPVVSLKRQGNVWQARTPQGLVSAPKAILTVNGHLQSFGHYQQHLVHVFTYGSMTQALTAAEWEQNYHSQSCNLRPFAVSG